jgi:hypothetical protein
MSNPIARVASLPVYQDGMSAGVDVGLAIAMTAITNERIHQERMASRTDSGSPAAACIVYADGVLHEMSKVLARGFWQ